MVRITRIAPLAMALALASTGAMAESKDRIGWYVGGAAGISSVSADAAPLIDVSDDAFTTQVYGGYNFTPWFGLESNFSYTPSIEESGELDDSSLSTLSFMAKLNIPVGDKVDLYAKAGPSFMLLTEERQGYWDDWDDREDYDDDDNVDWSEMTIGFGVGMNVEVSPHVNIRIAVDYADETLEDGGLWADTPVEEIDVEFTRTTVGLHYQF